jgi:hypothetical protein
LFQSKQFGWLCALKIALKGFEKGKKEDEKAHDCDYLTSGNF